MSAIHLDNLVKTLRRLHRAEDHGPGDRRRRVHGAARPLGLRQVDDHEHDRRHGRTDRGRILFGGRDMAGVPMGRRGVGFVFQNYAIFTHMTVRQNLAYGPRMRGCAAERDRAAGRRHRRAAAAHAAARPAAPTGLSVNILQRIAIGRSAILEPAIFLLDEPLSNVDAAFRAVMRTELKHLQRQFKQTMVYVTHDQLEAMTMADRIAVMDHGVLQQVGTPLEVYNNPANIFVARFIGAPGMNLLTGRPAESDRGLVVDLGPLGASPPLPDRLAAAARGHGGEVLYGFRPGGAGRSRRGPGLALPVTFVERIGAAHHRPSRRRRDGGEGRLRQRCRPGRRRDGHRCARTAQLGAAVRRRHRPRAGGSGLSHGRDRLSQRHQALRRHARRRRCLLHRRRQRVLLLLRPAAVGQVDDPASDPRPGNAGCGRDPDRRPPGQPASARLRATSPWCSRTWRCSRT